MGTMSAEPVVGYTMGKVRRGRREGRKSDVGAEIMDSNEGREHDEWIRRVLKVGRMLLICE